MGGQLGLRAPLQAQLTPLRSNYIGKCLWVPAKLYPVPAWEPPFLCCSVMGSVPASLSELAAGSRLAAPLLTTLGGGPEKEEVFL